MKRTILLLLALLLLLSACAGRETQAPLPQGGSGSEAPEQPPEPEPEPEIDHSWQFDTPENHNMNPEVFAALHEALKDSSVYAMVTAKDGVIIDEYYGSEYDENSRFGLHSCSKSLTSALIGIAIEQGHIGGVDDLLSDYLPQVAALEDTRKHQLTLRHLLTHTSGLEWYEWGGGRSNWQEFRSAPNWVEYILGRSLVAQPGAVFNYSTGNTHLLSAVLEQATGMSQSEYSRANLFEPLGIESATWGADPQGVTDGGNGVRMTARDAARFGQLYLEGGLWKGRQVIPAEWVAESTSVQNPGPGGSTGQYGYQWWIRSFGAGDYDTYYALGAFGQYILVVPELDLVTVIASRYPQDTYAPRPYFVDYVLAAYNG